MRSHALLLLLLTVGCNRSPLAGDPPETPGDGAVEPHFDLSLPPPTDLSSPPPKDMTGTLCGGFANAKCPIGSFCEWSETPWCGRGDGIGHCIERPEGCVQYYDPVCGCDGKTYGNDCARMSSSVGLQYRGVCGCTPPCSAAERCAQCANGLRCISLGTNCN